jgi:hypothetical protein
MKLTRFADYLPRVLIFLAHRHGSKLRGALQTAQVQYLKTLDAFTMAVVMGRDSFWDPSSVPISPDRAQPSEHSLQLRSAGSPAAEGAMMLYDDNVSEFPGLPSARCEGSVA